MIEIRTRDRLFLILLVPALAAGAYWCGWRTDAARAVDQLRAHEARLVAVDDFTFEKGRATRELTAAKIELGNERAIPMPRAKMRGDAADPVARREMSVICTLRAAGLQILRVESTGAGKKGGETLGATGLRPQPAARRYVLTGTYPQIRRALETFSAREMAVIVDSLSMAGSDANRWNLALWL